MSEILMPRIPNGAQEKNPRLDAVCVFFAIEYLKRLRDCASPDSAKHLGLIIDRLLSIVGRLALDALSTWGAPGEFDLLQWICDQKNGVEGRRFERAFDSSHGRLILDELQAAIDEQALAARRKAREELRAANEAALKVIEETPALAAVHSRKESPCLT